MNVDRIIKEEGRVVVSIDKTKYKNDDVEILRVWYPDQYKTMKLIEISDDEGYINYHFGCSMMKEFSTQAMTTLEKLMCAYSLFQYETLFTQGYQVSFETQNIFLDCGNNVEVLFVERVDLYDGEFHKEDFFTQLKARILSMFTRYSFGEIMGANFNLAFKTKFEQSVLEAENVTALRLIVGNYIDEKKAEQDDNYVFVTKKSFILYRILTFVFLSLFVVISTFSIFNYFGNIKELEFENRLYSYFVQRDYNGTITYSQGNKLNKEQKYIVGYSAIMTLSLDESKKQVILSTYNQNVSEAILEYWMYIGYGNYSEAANRAKALNNSEYTLYALRLEENRLLNTDSMDGTEKQQQLESVRSEIAKLEEELKVVEEVVEEVEIVEDTDEVSTDE